ncbi:MAG: methionyl-tRNA formyltransferase, partial [Devosiaceae bacterium]|nr:methionyl-tRNA formyltransferase [Devosiaceae bacterium]
MRIIFMGTPEFGIPTFEQLLSDGHEIVACYTQPPRPAGRGKQDRKSPVHLAALSADVPVFFPESLKSEHEQVRFAGHNADLAIVVAYGLLLPKLVLDAPKYGCLNLHGSALPRWRGAAPIQRAIMAGDTQTAIQVMAMETGLDTGAVCASTPIAIT